MAQTRGLTDRARALRWLCCAVGCLLPLWAAAQAVPVQPAGAGARDLLAHVTYLEDSSASLTLEQVQLADRTGRFAPPPPTGGALSFGLTRSAMWLRVALHNPGAQPSTQLLVVPNALISHVSLYAPDASGHYQATHTGGDQPFATRPYPDRQLAFPLVVPAQAEPVLYLRVQSTIGLLVPLQLWPQADYAKQARYDYGVQAWYFGMAAAMALFNLMLFIALRDRIYLLYVAFVVCMAITLARKGGLATEFLWPAAVTWTNVSYYSGASLALVAFMLFTRRMLNTAVLLPRADRLLQVLVVLHLVAVVGYVLALEAVVRYALGLFLVSALTVVAVGVWGVVMRMRSAYFYMGAFAVLLLGAVTTLLRTLGWLPTNVLTVDGLQLGSALEMLLLAFALADRTRQLQALNEKLEALSMVDGLTGIANRRQFDQELHKAWARLERLGQPLALVMLDVDMFKRYNDHYGHQAGDECLRNVAQAIASVGRITDVVARYGGEEFVMVAPASDGPNALLLAQRACQAVQALGAVHPHSPCGVVTVSCGAACIVPGAGHTPQDLLRQADAALYQAKAQGGNQVVLASL